MAINVNFTIPDTETANRITVAFGVANVEEFKLKVVSWVKNVVKRHESRPQEVNVDDIIAGE